MRRRTPAIVSLQALALLLACALPLAAAAECRRIPTGQGQDLDGPGSFGALDGTVTLDCLKYVGSIEQNGAEYVLIRDERDTVHRLRIGDRMGENGGVISRIDKDAIYVNQYIKRDGKWEETVVRFSKK
jgi:hypothetical protein